MTKNESVSKLLTWANAQIGTRESNNNYNRYAAIAESMRMYGWNVQNQPWCDVFVDAGFVECFGLEGAAKLTCQPLGGFSAACRAGGSATMAHTHTISHTHNLDSNGYAKMTLYSSGGDVSYREKSGVTAWTANFRVTGSGGAGSSTSLSSTYGAELGGRTAGSSAANTGAASNTDNMPPYLTVYMWKRTK